MLLLSLGFLGVDGFGLCDMNEMFQSDVLQQFEMLLLCKQDMQFRLLRKYTSTLKMSQR